MSTLALANSESSLVVTYRNCGAKSRDLACAGLLLDDSNLDYLGRDSGEKQALSLSLAPEPSTLAGKTSLSEVILPSETIVPSLVLSESQGPRSS
jgi:hypothetical protein